jgi:hypothetical protein
MLLFAAQAAKGGKESNGFTKLGWIFMGVFELLNLVERLTVDLSISCIALQAIPLVTPTTS